MLEYMKGNSDAKYRIISLDAESSAEFKDMDDRGDIISFEPNQVLEIIDNADNRRLEYTAVKKHVNYHRDGNKIRIPKDVPLYRLWVRKRGEPDGMWYKVPYNLPVVDDKYEMLIPAGANKVELIGDEYFMMVYYL